MPISVASTDTRVLSFPLPLSKADTLELGSQLIEAGRDGYYIQTAQTHFGGNQRDEYVTGLKITLSR